MSEIEETTRVITLSNQTNYHAWTTDFLTDYIVNVHHDYLNHALPLLEMRIIAFEDGHKKKFPELTQILKAFLELLPLLQLQTRQEEEVIFPYIRQIDSAFRRKESYANLFVKTLRKPLHLIETEHNKIGTLMTRLKSAGNNYTFPEKACTNHQVLYHKLTEFHNDIVQHRHLELNILLPRARGIENESLML